MTTAYKFLIVDDDDDARFFTTRTLKRVFAGCQIVSAGSASVALDVIKHDGPVDAVVTDNDLGGMSGRELVAELRRRGLTCPIIMLTCSGDPEVSADAYKAGATYVYCLGEAADDAFAFLLKEELGVRGAPARV